jgi:hypothetical protein
MNQTTFLTAACCLFTAINAQAGSSSSAGKAPASSAPISVPESSAFSGSVTLGYDSTYIYRGGQIYGWSDNVINGGPLDKADHLISGAVEVNVPLSDKLNLNAKGWYADSADADYNELDLYTRLDYNAGPFTIGPSFTWYHYPEFTDKPVVDNQYEFGIEASTSPVEGLTLSFGGFYEIEVEQWYLQAGASYTVPLNDSVSLVFGAVASYLILDEAGYDDFHHVGVSLKAPIKLSNNVTLAPYIAGNFPVGDILDHQDNQVLGGVALTVSF